MFTCKDFWQIFHPFAKALQTQKTGLSWQIPVNINQSKNAGI